MNQFIQDLTAILSLLNQEFGINAPATQQIQNFVNRYSTVQMSDFIVEDYNPADPPTLPPYEQLAVLKDNTL